MQALLEENPAKHPIIILKDVPFQVYTTSSLSPFLLNEVFIKMGRGRDGINMTFYFPPTTISTMYEREGKIGNWFPIPFLLISFKHRLIKNWLQKKILSVSSLGSLFFHCLITLLFIYFLVSKYIMNTSIIKGL